MFPLNLPSKEPDSCSVGWKWLMEEKPNQSTKSIQETVPENRVTLCGIEMKDENKHKTTSFQNF